MWKNDMQWWITYLECSWWYVCWLCEVNVFPTQIEEVLLQIEEIGPHYEILWRERTLMWWRFRGIDRWQITWDCAVMQNGVSWSRESKAGLKSALGLASNIAGSTTYIITAFEGKAKCDWFTKRMDYKWQIWIKSNYASGNEAIARGA